MGDIHETLAKVHEAGSQVLDMLARVQEEEQVARRKHETAQTARVAAERDLAASRAAEESAFQVLTAASTRRAQWQAKMAELDGHTRKVQQALAELASSAARAGEL